MGYLQTAKTSASAASGREFRKTIAIPDVTVGVRVPDSLHECLADALVENKTLTNAAVAEFEAKLAALNKLRTTAREWVHMVVLDHVTTRLSRYEQKTYKTAILLGLEEFDIANEGMMAQTPAAAVRFPQSVCA